MIAFVRGLVAGTGTDSVYLDVNGLGFEITVPARTLERLLPPGQDVFLHTYLQVSENEFKLYGFLDKGELELFRTLMAVPGMGAKTCLAVVAAMAPGDLYQAVLAGDEKSLTRIPGIGPKMAQRLIFELKGRLSRLVPAGAGGDVSRPAWEEVLAALETLGYTRSEVFPILMELQSKNELGDRLEDNLKKVLRIRAGSMKL